MSPDHTQLSLTALMVQPHPDVAATSPDAINVTAQQTKPHRRPLVPMNASEAISMVFVELGLSVIVKVVVACPTLSPGYFTGVLSASRSGLSETTSIGSQLRVLPLQRSGWASRAVWLRALR